MSAQETAGAVRGAGFEEYSENAEEIAADVYLTFSVAENEYAVAVAGVREILGLPERTEVPDMPTYVKGVINLRGRVVPLIDMGLRLGHQSESEYGERTCVIIIEVGRLLAGLIVDSVNEVMRIPEEDLEPAPRFSAEGGRSHRFIRSIGKTEDGVKLVVDLGGLLDEQGRRVLEQTETISS